ncbi:hypothetical protein P8452_48499 [Trifolium repens]|nr:hypothetical protein P8452_48499 [Trifolium repens]
MKAEFDVDYFEPPCQTDADCEPAWNDRSFNSHKNKKIFDSSFLFIFLFLSSDSESRESNLAREKSRRFTLNLQDLHFFMKFD